MHINLPVVRQSMFAIIITILLGTASCHAAGTSGNTAPSIPVGKARSIKPLTHVINTICAARFKPDGPGAAVIVIKNGNVVLRKAYGMANMERHIPLRPDMTFRVGSLTKQFTAAGIMLLVEEGKISLSDSLRKYVPEYPPYADDVTIEHLLTHTSGIENLFSHPGFGAVAGKAVTVDEAIAFFKDAAPDFKPGERYVYSNTNYFLLGAIIERVSGMPYGEFVDIHIFKPLGMTHTRLDTAANETPQVVKGYINSGGRFAAASWGGINWPFAAGALRTNIDDLAIWGKVITGRRLLKPESWMLMTTSHQLPGGKPTGYAYGLAVGTDDVGTYIRHSGEIDGFNASELMYPARGIFIAVLENVDPYDPPAQEMTRQIAAVMGKS